MPPVEEEEIETIVLKKISVEKRLHVKEIASPKETILDIQTGEPLEIKISPKRVYGTQKPEGDEREKEDLKYFVMAPEGEELEMTHVDSRKSPTLTYEKEEAAIDHITYVKDKPLTPDEELESIYIASEHKERDSREENLGKTELVIHKEDVPERLLGKSRVPHKENIPVHEKEVVVESNSVHKYISPEPHDQKSVLRKDRKSKIRLQPEEFPLKGKTSFVKDITDTGVAETSLLKNEEEGGCFTSERSEEVLGESVKKYDTEEKAHETEKSHTTVAGIPIDKILSNKVKKMEATQNNEKNEHLGLPLEKLDSFELPEETEPIMKKDVNLDHTADGTEPSRGKTRQIIKQSIKPRLEEMQAGEKYSAVEGEPTEAHYEEHSGPSQSTPHEKIPVEKEFDTVITREGTESELSLGKYEKGAREEIADKFEPVKKVLIQPSRIHDKKQHQKVQLALQATQDEREEPPALKNVSKVETEENKSPLSVEEAKVSGGELPGMEGTSDEKSIIKYGVGKIISVNRKEKEKLSDKTPSSKESTAYGEVPCTSSIGKTITPKKVEDLNIGKKEYQKSEPARVIEQASSLSGENLDLDEPGESQEVVDVPAKSHAKRGGREA
ncbi:PREDICTED: uncharacterized protein LOC104572225 [Tinamus guttatus]|uniref:uncharacterized protein LOC104572225 n=1 Tax=Tinamus guttatus TaxID=94827 RepID=UPI00052E8EAB|nr:PREDICTED: uncharacterized protein LOC104572225 [Tinamus guttatus]